MKTAFAFFISLAAHPLSFADPVSLLQESQEIECKVSGGISEVAALWVDKKDYLLKLTHKDGKVEEFSQVKFLDRAVLAQSQLNQKRFLLFQIFNNGQTWIHLGSRFNLKEKDCEDTGASKRCKNAEIKSFLWTPEKLALKSKSHDLSVEISHYGFFPNKATFAYGQQAKKSNVGYPSLLLIDYGASVEILAGHSSRLKCRYKK